MTLAALLDELTDASMTVPELAARLGVTVPEVWGMIGALRAAGRLGAMTTLPSAAGCGASGGCAGACPGPDGCPLVIALGTESWAKAP